MPNGLFIEPCNTGVSDGVGQARGKRGKGILLTKATTESVPRQAARRGIGEDAAGASAAHRQIGEANEGDKARSRSHGSDTLRESRSAESLRTALDRTVSCKVAILLVVVSASLSVLAACGGDGQTIGESAADERVEQEAEAEAHAGNAEATLGSTASARAGGEATMGGASTEVEKATVGSAAGEDRSQRVTLRIEGSPGTKFSGTCLVGEEKQIIGGQVPERYIYDVGGTRLRCEVRKRAADAGNLRVVFSAGNDFTSVQQTSSQNTTINLFYGDGGVFSAISSSSLGGEQTSDR